MLEKSEGNADAQQIEAILLLEVDFNAAHKIIFNDRLMPNLEGMNAILSKVIEGRQS